MDTPQFLTIVLSGSGRRYCATLSGLDAPTTVWGDTPAELFTALLTRVQSLTPSQTQEIFAPLLEGQRHGTAA